MNTFLINGPELQHNKKIEIETELLQALAG